MSKYYIPTGKIIKIPAGEKWYIPSGLVATEPSAAAPSADVFIEGLHEIYDGLKPLTAAGLNGVLQT